jgi:argininosuccinate synthase
VELDGLKQLYETDCNMVMASVEGDKMENINEEPKIKVKKKKRQVPKLKEGL